MRYQYNRKLLNTTTCYLIQQRVGYYDIVHLVQQHCFPAQHYVVLYNIVA